MKIVGVLGGFGPETTAEFYVSIVEKNRSFSGSHPNILIHNSPVPFGLEEDAVKNGRNLNKFLPILFDSVKIIQNKVDFIVLPCNTLHIFIEDLRKISKKPVLSIIEEIAVEVKQRSLKKVGLLATLKTFKERIYDTKLHENGIEVVKPSDSDMIRLSQIIHLILQGVKSDNLKTELIAITNGLKQNGAEAVILGCTDLQLLLKQSDSSLPLIDTMDVLANSTVKLINETEGKNARR
ncbi:MAG: amino acid racemase [Candidatus Aenigmarchaeota archaeon]|nr:amino acid racemase [Candidatus Aenigmarchaeota archaeon]